MAIIGAILGDICGSQYEFYRPDNLDYKHCDLFTDNCRYTDDTVLSIATKWAIDNKMNLALAYKLFAQQYPNMGYGSMFEDWFRFDKNEPYNSFGNGSAMRCSYIGEYFDDIENVIKYATKSAECTHNHPEGIKGAVVTSVCVWMAKHNSTKAEIYAYALKHYSSKDYTYGVDLSLDSYRDTYEWSEICQDTVPVAIRCFLESENYESFLRNCMSLKCDMDTVAAIGGGIAEEYYKETRLDNEFLLNKYLDKDLLELLKGSANYENE